MNYPLIATFLILGIASVLFLTDRIRADVVALLIMVSLGITGVLTPAEAFAGFSRSAVITIMAIFILAQGLQRTGITDQVGAFLLRLTGPQEGRLVTLTMVTGAFLSLFMNNIAAASVLLPAVSVAARKVGVNPSRVMMPLAFATILGGMATLFTTANIVASGLLRDANLPGFGVFEFAPVGIPVVIVGVLYMVLWGRNRLPTRSTAERIQAVTEGDPDLLKTYQLGEHLFRARLPRGSSLHNQSLAQTPLRKVYNVYVVAVEREGEITLTPSPSFVLQEGDIVVLEGDAEDFQRRDVEPYLEILPAPEWQEDDLESASIAVVEAVLAPRSTLIGQTVEESRFRERYDMSILAILRGDQPIVRDIVSQRFQFGDALLLQGPRSRLGVLEQSRNLLVLSGGKARVVQHHRGGLALLIMGATLLLATIFSSMVGEIMLAGAVAMVLTRILTMDQGYDAIEWKSVFVIAGVLPLGVAMTKTGAAELLANGLMATVGPLGVVAVLAGVILLTTLLAQVMNGAAVVAVLGPIAIQAAQSTQADPRMFVMGVALASSLAFITPLGSPVNMLVIGQGGYTFRDYAKVGTPLVLMLYLLIVLLLPMTWTAGR